jgi:hypothetical protein
MPPPLIHLNLLVEASITAGKTAVHLSNISEQAGKPDLSSMLLESSAYDFHVGAWMGMDNPHMAFEMLKEKGGAGQASLSIPILPGDPNTLKLGIFIRDPKTCMQRHFASSFVGLLKLADSIEGITDCSKSNSIMTIKDNYSPNKAVLKFANNGTDLAKFKSICAQLQPSAMLKTLELNQKVMEMTEGLHNLIQATAQVSNNNGGQNFVNSMCFTQSMGCAINYPLLNMTYDSTRHRTPLPVLSYMALATLHNVGLSAEDALALPDHEFMQKFFVPMCTSFTVCPRTMIYSGDETLDAKGTLDQPTEDFGMVQCHHYYIGVDKSYTDRYPHLRDLSNNQLNDHLKTIAACPESDSKGHFLIADDCETLSGQILSIAGGVHLASQVLAGGDHAKLGDMMWDCTRDLPNLADVPKEDFHACAKLMNRYGELRENSNKGKLPRAQIGLGIVSAKGASFAMGKTELNGHSCTLAQTISADGKASYCVGEGTTNLGMLDLPDSCPKKVNILLAEGLKIFSTSEALGIVAQNMGDMTATKGKTRVRQVIGYNYSGKDAYDSCPFYMGCFYAGLEMGANIPGIIPLDTEKHSFMLAGDVANPSPAQPLFGAPVANLCAKTVRAVPINLGKVMGERLAGEFLSGINQRNLESTPPRASDETLKKVMSRWGKLQALGKQSINASTHWVLSCAEGFDDADMLRGVAEYKTRLAREFNALQDRDPIGDGIKMTVKTHMLSVLAQFIVPLPVREKWDLTCAKNMRLALKALPFGGGGVGMQSQFSLM